MKARAHASSSESAHAHGAAPLSAPEGAMAALLLLPADGGVRARALRIAPSYGTSPGGGWRGADAALQAETAAAETGGSWRGGVGEGTKMREIEVERVERDIERYVGGGGDEWLEGATGGGWEGRTVRKVSTRQSRHGAIEVGRVERDRYVDRGRAILIRR